MRRSIRKFNIPPRATPWAFELLKTSLFKFPPTNAPPISTELPLLKDKVKFVFNQTLDTPFKERDAVTDTFKLILKTLLKELFTNKGEILSCKSVKPCKNRKSSRAYFVRTKLIRFKFPTLPTQHSNSPLPGHDVQSNARGIPGGGMLKFRIDRRISFVRWNSSSKYRPPHRLRLDCKCYL